MSAIAGTSLTAATAQATTFYSTWIAPGSGSWGDPGNWSGNRYPGNYFIPPPPLGGEPQTGEFFVTVNATGGPAYTITEPNLIGVSDFHLASPTATLAVVANGTFASVNGINLDAGTLLLNGGLIANSTINFNGGTMVFSNNTNNRLNNAFVNGNLNVGSGGYARMQFGSNFTGSIASVSGDGAVLEYEYNAVLDSKTINLDGGATQAASLDVDNGSSVAIGPNTTVRGSRAAITWGKTSGVASTLNNSGTITADTNGATFTVDTANLFNNFSGTIKAINGGVMNITSGSFNNNGRVSAVGSTLNITGTTWQNPGTISVSNGTLNLGGTWTNVSTISVANSAVNLGGTFSTVSVANGHFARSGGGTVNLTGWLDNAGATLSLDATSGNWNLAGGAISGGTITTAAGGSLVIGTSSQNRLTNNALFVGDITMGDNARLQLLNGANFTGDATLTSGAVLGFGYTGTLDNKTINLDGTSADAALSAEGSGTLTLGPGMNVRGSRGRVSYSYFTGGSPTVVNQGSITADTLGNTFTVDTSNIINGVPGGTPPGSPSTGIMRAINGATLTIAGATMSNAGTIAETNSALNINTGSWTNAGLIQGSGGTINLAGRWNNTGSINVTNAALSMGGTFNNASVTGSHLARSGGSVSLTGFLDNSGATLALSSTTGDWTMNGGAISGGTVTTAAGGSLLFSTSPGNRFADGATYVGDINLPASGARLRFQTGANFTGNANVTGSGAALGFEYNALLDNKTISLDGASSDAILSAEGNAVLTLGPNTTVRGKHGSISSGYFVGGTPAVINQGHVTADGTGLTFTINPGTFTNAATGTVRAANGSTLTISSSNWSSAGTLAVDAASAMNLNNNWSNAGGTFAVNGGTLNLNGTFTTSGLSLPNFTRAGGTVNLAGKLDNIGSTFAVTSQQGAFNLAGGAISGGTITTSGAGSLVFSSNAQNRISDNAVLVGDVNMPLTNARLRLQNGGTFTGNASLTGGGAILGIEETTTLANKTINLDGAGNNAATLSIEGSNTLTIAPTTTVRGSRAGLSYGYFVGGSNPTLVNQGTIAADTSGATFTVDTTNVTNAGRIRAINGGILATGSSINLTNNGTIEALAGGKVILPKAPATLGHVVDDGPGSVVRAGGTYTIDSPVAVTNRATLNLQGNWTRAADIDTGGQVIFDYPTPTTGNPNPSPIAAIRSAIISGRNGGAWNGSGLYSSAAAAVGADGANLHKTSLGYVESAAVGTSSFGGESVDPTEVLVRYTLAGDANLSGTVDLTDFTFLAANFNKTAGASWLNGDFNYDDKVDLTDFTFLASNFNQSLAAGGDYSLRSSPGSPVPEPSGLLGALLATSTLSARRARRKSASR